ncbi:helix-turn-helix domain-containing protein [Microbacterium sp.]|uniref:helix-turn-helix domain-containing protein n=1 Tax=Microbacterium sp. TaxID=51671 RepID=UPI0039E5D2EA
MGNPRPLRPIRGRSQQEFAQDLGSHRTYLSSAERSERNLTLELGIETRGPARR